MCPRSSLVSRFDIFDNGVETAMFISGILNNSLRAIRFHKRVFTFNFITISGLPLTLDIMGVQIMDCVIVVVLGMSLQDQHFYFTIFLKTTKQEIAERKPKR